MARPYGRSEQEEESDEVINEPVLSEDLYFYHTDHLGTPIAMTSMAGSLVWRAEHLPFGGIWSLPVSTVTNNLRFPGQYFDGETGLAQNWFRDYSARTGRYVESDPIGLEGGINTYLYVAANPTRWVDPLGLYRRGDVIYRVDPRNPSSADVAFVWADPTPDQDGNGDETILSFGNPSRCPDTCSPYAQEVRLGSDQDHYRNWPIVRHWKPNQRSRESVETYEQRWNAWQRRNPKWTEMGEQPEAQCYNLVNAMTGTADESLFGFRRLPYWRQRTTAP